ncbi:MAG: Prolipoprotein diacylglyceryl transferase [Planctomycetes bacterium ADurb.Bin412]|nr:MAG: Prolipoprotein diacylglyceryl transferase [Planctomycetes bacterium ADurb.Bin412]
MRPELFSIPFIHLSIKSYGFMMVLGFLAALLLARWRCKKQGENPAPIADFGLIALLAGVIGARLFHVFHNWSYYRDYPREIFAIWSGGLEFLGGVILAAAAMVIYFRRKKLPLRTYLDILAPSLMLGLAFGRMGCFLNGCCFGAPTTVPWAITFPAVNTMTHSGSGCAKETQYQYSYPYEYQLTPDRCRHPENGPLLELPPDYYEGYIDSEGYLVDSDQAVPPGKNWYRAPKRILDLSRRQIGELRQGKHPMHPIHPAQLYAIANALLLCLILNGIYRFRKFDGWVFAWMLILYGFTRLGLEFLRTDSPLEFDGLTISQNLGILLVLIGLGMHWFGRTKRWGKESIR